MVYQPLVQPDKIFARVNSLSSSFQADELLRRCFESDILPSRSTHPRKFTRRDIFAELYTAERDWVDGVAFDPGSSERYEKFLHMLFWEEKVRHPIICITGSVGSGKSTLVDFYLRCFCPEDPQRRESFEQKLVVHFDARDIQDNTDFYHLFFLYIQASVRQQCLGAQTPYDIDAAIKQRPTQPNNVREWVWAAFEELSKFSGRGVPSSPFRYIVLVIDNLDQTPPTVQIRAITEVEQWIRNPLIHLWRVYLPLWPSTLSFLRNHRFNMLRDAREVRLGPLDSDTLMGNRERAIDDQLRDSSHSSIQASSEYFCEILPFARKRLLDRVGGLSHGSLRLMLSLWSGFLKSESAFGIWRQRRAGSDLNRTFDYELLDALIVGAYEVLNQRTHRVANVFDMGHAHERPRDLLIGPHTMMLMAKGFHRERTLAAAVTKLGYSRENFHDAISAFGAFNMLHQVPVQNLDIEYEIHKAVILEYVGEPNTGSPRRGLIWEPAYVDNVAMVTPVSLSALASMRRTRGDRAEDFTDRTATTLEFLRFLKECEDSFRDPDQLKVGTNPAEFREELRTRQLPCLWRGMAIAYRSRLVGLQHSGLLRNIDPRWWEWLLNNPVFTAIDGASEFLEPL